MRASTLHVMLDLRGRYVVTHQKCYGTVQRFFTLRVEGPTEPPLPIEDMSHADFLRWQVGLIDRGYRIEDSSSVLIG